MAFETTSAEETRMLGQLLGEALLPGMAVALKGNLGAGKTQFAKGVATGLGIDPEDVTSPTFSIVQSYKGRHLLHHVDLYRLADAKEASGIGFDELFTEDTIVLVEWAERLPEPLVEDCLYVTMETIAETTRSISFNAYGSNSKKFLENWIKTQER